MRLLAHPVWAEQAFREFLWNVRERPGTAADARILWYFQLCGFDPGPAGDETPWCAAAMNACLVINGIRGTGRVNAKSFLSWGVEIEEPRRGAVVVLHRGDPSSWQGHVGVLVNLNAQWVWLLGANQGNAWSIQSYARERLAGMRWATDAERFVDRREED